MRLAAETRNLSANEQRSFDLLPLGLCLVDRQMMIQGWNRTIAEWTGLACEEVLGRPCDEPLRRLGSFPLRERIETVLCGREDGGEMCPLHATLVRGESDSNRVEMTHRTTVRRWDDTAELALVIVEDVTSEFAQIRNLLAERKTLRTAL